jgi:hypothetical protein
LSGTEAIAGRSVESTRAVTLSGEVAHEDNAAAVKVNVRIKPIVRGFMSDLPSLVCSSVIAPRGKFSTNDLMGAILHRRSCAQAIGSGALGAMIARAIDCWAQPVASSAAGNPALTLAPPTQ